MSIEIAKMFKMPKILNMINMFKLIRVKIIEIIRKVAQIQEITSEANMNIIKITMIIESKWGKMDRITQSIITTITTTNVACMDSIVWEMIGKTMVMVLATMVLALATIAKVREGPQTLEEPWELSEGGETMGILLAKAKQWLREYKNK